MVNVNKLRGKIVECGTNINELAKKIGINKATLYRKLSGGGGALLISEADIIAHVLQLTADETKEIFFSQYNA